MRWRVEGCGMWADQTENDWDVQRLSTDVGGQIWLECCCSLKYWITSLQSASNEKGGYLLVSAGVPKQIC